MYSSYPEAQRHRWFSTAALHDFDEFDLLVAPPTVPKVLVKNKMVDDDKDPGYLEQLINYQVTRYAYIAIKTLEPSNIEWSKVDMKDPTTWQAGLMNSPLCYQWSSNVD